MKDMFKLFSELRRAHLFAQVDDAQLETLANVMQEVKLGPGEMLFTHGQAADRFFFVRSGRVKLFRLSPEGQEKIIEVVDPGQTFAEAVMFMGTQGHYPVNAQSMNDAQLYAFDQTQFLKILSESPETCLGMLSAMSRRLHMLINQIDSLALQNATYRLAMYLLEHAPQSLAEATEIELTTPKGMIASQLGIQPETFSRILAKFRRLSLIEVNGNHIALRDLRGLRHLAYTPAPDDNI